MELAKELPIHNRNHLDTTSMPGFCKCWVLHLKDRNILLHTALQNQDDHQYSSSLWRKGNNFLLLVDSFNQQVCKYHRDRQWVQLNRVGNSCMLDNLSG